MKYTMFLLSSLLLLAACSQTSVSTFEECASATGVVMESYPRQCSYEGKTFVEQLDENTDMPVSAQLCPDPRPTAATREYVPVLGSDGSEYPNWRTACMNEEVVWYELLPEPSGELFEESPVYTTCTDEQKQAQACTMDYRPTCALVPNNIQCITAPCATVDAVTAGNTCGACAMQAQGYYEGACDDLTFVVCQPTQSGFSAQEHAKNIGGICVDVCPANMDAYMTQIGVELCIPHYGEKEISQWTTCSKSSDSCDCVNTYETTDNQEVTDAQYRCVPEQYGTRLLFRGGLDRLDEHGEQSVMIA